MALSRLGHARLRPGLLEETGLTWRHPPRRRSPEQRAPPDSQRRATLRDHPVDEGTKIRANTR